METYNKSDRGYKPPLANEIAANQQFSTLYQTVKRKYRVLNRERLFRDGYSEAMISKLFAMDDN